MRGAQLHRTLAEFAGERAATARVNQKIVVASKVEGEGECAQK